MDRLKGCFSISQVQSLNFSSGYFSTSTAGSYLDLRLRLYLSDGNYMFTTGAQTLQLNQCFLEVHGIKYSPKVHNELIEV